MRTCTETITICSCYPVPPFDNWKRDIDENYWKFSLVSLSSIKRLKQKPISRISLFFFSLLICTKKATLYHDTNKPQTLSVLTTHGRDSPWCSLSRFVHFIKFVFSRRYRWRCWHHLLLANSTFSLTNWCHVCGRQGRVSQLAIGHILGRRTKTASSARKQWTGWCCMVCQTPGMMLWCVCLVEFKRIIPVLCNFTTLLCYCCFVFVAH